MSGLKDDSLPRLDPSALQQKAYSERLKGKRPSPDLFDFETLERLEIEYVPVESLYPNNWNPNRMNEREFELLMLSIEEDGYTQPVLVNQKNKIIDGEHRWRAAAALGFDEIPVVRVNMGDVQARISTIRHNIARGTNVSSLEETIYRELEQLDGMEWANHSLLLGGVDIGEVGVEDVWEESEVVSSGEKVTKSLGEEVVQQEVDSFPEFETFMSLQAQKIQHMREEILPRAKTPEERERIKAEMHIYRLSLAFSKEEAEVVRDALSGNSAEVVLDLCRKIVGEVDYDSKN